MTRLGRHLRSLLTWPPDWRSRLLAAGGSLKLRLTAGGIAALTVGIGLATLLLVRQAERDTLAAYRDHEMNEAVHGAALLSRRVVSLQRALQVTAAQLDVATLNDDARLAAFVDAASLLRSLFSAVVVADARGAVRISVSEDGKRSPLRSIGDRPHFQRTMAELRPVISEPLLNRLNGEPALVFTYPLRNASGGYGVLSGSLRLAVRDLLDDLVGSTGTEHDALVVVTDGSGRILAHPQPNRLLQSLASEPRLAAAFSQWQRDGAPVEPAGLELHQPASAISAAGVAGLDWMVWRALPHDVLLAPLHAARRHTLAWAAGLIALMSLGLLAILWWLLRPLTQLEHRAQHLFDSARDAQAGWPETGGEIGRVARVLRHVAAERAQLESFNAQVLEKLGSVMTAAPVGIAFVRDERLELVSTEWCRLFGCTEASMLGQPVWQFHASGSDCYLMPRRIAQSFLAGQPFVAECRMRRIDGSEFWARLRGRPVNAANPAAGSIWTLNDITEQVASREQLEWSAMHDSLTGLANRRVFEQALQRLLASLPASLPAALVMIDLDHFKSINDSAGHAAGDAILRAVAAAAAACVRASDLVVRLGGDEFALLLESCGHETALRVAEQTRAAITGISLPWEGRSLCVGASLGVASLAADTPDAGAWVRAADAACYAAKAEGRNAVRVAERPPLRVVKSVG